MTLATARRSASPIFLALLAALLVGVSPCAVGAQSSPGLVAAWGFNEGTGTTTADASGNGNTGTISGATWTTAGRYGNALVFDGVNDLVVVNASSSLNLTTAMTLSAWVYPTGAQSGWRTILQREVDAYFLNASSASGTRRPAGGGTFSGSVNVVSGTASLALNTWTHVALTWDGATMRLWVNGVQRASRVQGGGLESNTNPLRIGGNVAYGEWFRGRLDEIRIYNRALSQADLQTDMATAVGEGLPPGDTTSPVVTITAPTSNPTLSVTTTPISLGGTASDDVGVTQVTWVNDRGGTGTAAGTTNWTASGIALQSGTNVLTVTARDAVGNTSTDTLTVTYTPDTTVPTVTITTPTSNPTLAVTATPLSIGGTAGDDLGVTQVTWVNDRGGNGTAAGTTSWTASSIVLQSGTNVVTVTARDAAGNASTDTLTVTYTPPDTTVPTVTITTPTSNPTLAVTATPLSIGGTAGDDVGVTQVTWVNDRGGSGTAAGTTSWTASSIALQSGTNVVTVTARDAAGNASTDTLTVTYTPPDTTVPTVTITTPTSNPTVTVTATPLNIGGTASDDVGVTQVTWANDRGGSGTAAGTTGWTVSGITLQAGVNVLTVTGRDAAGNTGTDTLTVTYTTAPTVAITTPTSNPTVTVTATPLNIGGTASDDVGVTQVTWANDRGGSGTAAGTTGWTVSGITLQAGVNVLTVTARDAAGNTGTATLTVTYTPDTIVPTVTITTPTSNPTVTVTATPLNIGGTASDDVGVTQVTWANDRGGSGTAAGTTGWTVSGITLQAGVNVLTVTARDAAGNTGTATLTVTYTPDTTVPTVTITTPTSNPTVTVTATPLNIGGTASDDVGVTQVTWVNDRGGSGTAAGTTGWTVSGITLQAGVNVLTVTGRDAAGNTGTDTLTVTYTPDTTVPTVTITTPTSNPTVTVTATPLNIGGTASDDVGVTQVTWANDRGGSGTAAGTTGWTVSGITLQAGVNVLTVTGRDAAGNTGTATLTVTYTPPIPPGLVAAWGFNEGTGTTTSDASGNGNTGTISGATWTTAGRYGHALAFDGVNDLVVVNASSSLNLTTAMTLSAWVSPTAAQTGWRTILQREVDAYFLNASNSNGPRYPAGGGTFSGNVNVVSGTASLVLNTWTHVALTWDGATMRLWVNAVQVASVAQNGVLESNTNPLRIGGNVPYGEWFQGLLDEVRIYNRALSQAELQSDMATPVGAAMPPVDTTPPVVTITTPTSNPSLSVTATPLSIGGTASDNVGVTQVTWVNDRGGSGTAAGTTSWTASGIALQSGTNVLTVTARDATGNTSTDTLTVAYTPGGGGDVTPPTITIASPTSNPTHTATLTPLSIGGTASDNVAVTQVTWVNDRGGSGTAAGTTSWTASGIALQSGTNVLTVTARDAAGNTSTDALTVSYAPGGDSTPPVVSITSPSAGATVASTITLVASASDNVAVAGVRFFVDGIAIGAEDTSAPYSRLWNTSTVPPGVHVLTAQARDAAGNVATSSAVSVTVRTATAADIGEWSAPTPWPLVAVHATLMPNGRVLAFDGAGQGGAAFVWNPLNNQFTSASQGDNIFCSGHTLLADGRVFVVGGHIQNFVGIRDANIFDPTTSTWSPQPSMSVGRWYPTAIRLPDGRALVVSGDVDCSGCSAEIPEIYDPSTHQWTRLTSAALTLPQYPHLFVLPDGRILLTSAFDDPVATRVLDVNAQTWTVIDSRLLDAHSAAMFRLGRVVKSGTSASSDPPYFASSANTYVLDMNEATPAWREVPPMAFPRSYHNLTILPDGSVLATGGTRTTDPDDQSQGVFAAEVWAPDTETWTTMAANQIVRSYHTTALLLPDGRVLMAGSGRFGVVDQLSAEIYSPPYLFQGPRPLIGSAPAQVPYGFTFPVVTPDAARIATVSLMALASVTHGFDANQRYLSLAFTRSGGQVDVQAPANAATAPPGDYLLFLVDTNGVPSVGAFVRLP